MAKQNTAVQAAQTQVSPKEFFAKDNVKAKFQELMGKKANVFLTSVLQCVSQNPLLAKADVNSIYQSAMMAATLDLPINNNLGFAYIIPYNTKDGFDEQGKDKYKSVAQFQLGAKGFIQLAQRSGQFKTLSSTPIYAGQISQNNPLTGYEFDFSVSPSGNPVGYAAYFKLLNGFEKTFYMSTEEVSKHGKQYSKTFSFGVWKTNFEAMALKTVIKLLLSKFAPLSIEMQKAVTVDQSVINDAETEDITYIDQNEVEDKESERIFLMITDATTIADLDALKPHITDVTADAYNQKVAEVSNV